MLMTGDSLPVTASGEKLCFLFLLKVEVEVGSTATVHEELDVVGSVGVGLLASSGSIR